MYKQGKCYKCGGFLAVNEAEDATVCLFCNQPIVTEKAIRCFEENSAQAPAAPEKPVVADSDFVVAGGVLIRYDGFTKTDIRIPEGVKVIGDAAFQGMNNIESVQIPAGVEIIRAGAFSGCKNLHSVSIPAGVKIIDRDVFSGCISLKSVRFPDSVRILDAGALTGCTALESVMIPSAVELLPWRIFEGCISLKSVTIPEKVKTIEDYAFAECTALESVTFACMRANGDPSAGVRRIGMNAFRNCTALSRIDLPETVEYIGNQAFRGCEKLTALRIPQSVKAIYPLAFADCTALESVSFVGKTELYKGSNPYKHGNNVATFFNCPKLLTVDFRNLQKHYWAFPAYMKAQEPEFIAHGRCRYCGGKFIGAAAKVCTVCKAPKDY